MAAFECDGMGKKKQQSGTISGKIPLLKVAVALVLVFAGFLSLFFFYGPSYLNGYDSFVYSDLSYNLVHHQFGSVASISVLSTRFILLTGIAFFYAILGPTRLAESLFGVVCFLATIVLIFLIGRELYNEKAGMISAFLYSFFPIAVVQSSISSDSTAMALFVSLSVFLFIIARKKGSNRYYALSGVVAFLGVLTTIEEGMIFLFFLPVLFFYIAKNRDGRSVARALCFLGGVAAGLAMILLLGLFQTGNPFWFFSMNLNWFNVSWQINQFEQEPAFFSILDTLFPYGIIQTLGRIVGGLSLSLTPSYLFLAVQEILRVYPLDVFSGLAGYSGYAMLFAVAYLAFRREGRATFPSLWVLSTFLYMSFGTMSLSGYHFVFFTQRFLLLFSPAIVLLTGMGIARALEDTAKAKRGRSGFLPLRRYVVYGIILLGLLVMLAKAIALIKYAEYSAYASVFQMINVSDKINSLPNNLTVYTETDIPVQTFIEYGRIVGFYDGINNCSGFQPGSLVVVSKTSLGVSQQIQYLASSCRGWTLVSSPELPLWLRDYFTYHPAPGNEVELYRLPDS